MPTQPLTQITCPLCHSKWSEASGLQLDNCPSCNATEGEMFRACLPIIRRLQAANKPKLASLPAQVKKQPSPEEIHGEQRFPEAWALYPRKQGVSRANALKAWMARIRDGVTPEVMIAGTIAYAAYVKRLGTEQQYMKQPETFYGPARHFENDYGEEDGGGSGATEASQKPKGPYTPESRAREELERLYGSERWTA